MLKSERILVVDDSELVRELIICILEEEGYTNITEVENGYEALETLKNEKIDIIFSDWSMPIMTGYDLLKNIKEIEALKDIPFVMVSGETCIEGVKKVLNLGAKAYIPKPFTVKRIQSVLKKLEKENLEMIY